VLAGDGSMYSGQHRPLSCKFASIRQGIRDVGLMSPRLFFSTANKAKLSVWILLWHVFDLVNLTCSSGLAVDSFGRVLLRGKGLIS